MYQLRPPDPTLSRYIEHYWFVRAEPQAPFDLTVDVYVDLRADLIFNFGVPYRRGVGGAWVEQQASNLDAQRMHPIKIAQRGEIVNTGVRFRTGGLAAFTTESVHLWNDRIVPIDEAFAHTPELRDRSVDEQKALLDRYFRGRLALTPAKESFFALKERIEGGVTRMQELDAPMRQLDRLFKANLGFTPKTLARVVRFQAALSRLKRDPGCTLAEVAAECGYYDQSHFVREHKALAGVSPKQQVGYFPKDAPADFSPNLVQFVQDRDDE